MNGTRWDHVYVIHPNIYAFGGAEFHCAVLLDILQKRFSRVTLLHTGGPLDFEAIAEWSGIELDPTRVTFETVKTPWWIPNLVLFCYAAVIRVARHRVANADLVIASFGECPIQTPRLIQSVHVPLLFYDSESLSYLGVDIKSPASRLGRMIYILVTRLVMGWSPDVIAKHMTITNSAWTAEQFKRHYPGSNPRPMYPGAKIRNSSLTTFSARENNVVILGRVVAGKRTHEAIEIVRRLRERGHHNLGLYIIGKPREPYALRIRALMADAPWVQWHTDLGRDKLEALIANQKWGLHCYRFEHYGLAPAELQRLGCITFVHDSGGQREIIANPEQRYNNLDDAVNKMDTLMRAPNRHPEMLAQMIEQNTKHRPEAFIAAFNELIDEVMTALPQN